MTKVDIKARMYDLIVERDGIQFLANQQITELTKQAAEVKQAAEAKINPIQTELNNLYNQINESDE